VQGAFFWITLADYPSWGLSFAPLVLVGNFGGGISFTFCQAGAFVLLLPLSPCESVWVRINVFSFFLFFHLLHPIPVVIDFSHTHDCGISQGAFPPILSEVLLFFRLFSPTLFFPLFFVGWLYDRPFVCLERRPPHPHCIFYGTSWAKVSGARAF